MLGEYEEEQQEQERQRRSFLDGDILVKVCPSGQDRKRLTQYA